MIRKFIFSLFLIIAATVFTTGCNQPQSKTKNAKQETAAATNPLPSWNEGSTKNNIIDFMRVWAEQAYGIPPYQVVGSSGNVRYDTTGTEPVLIKLPEFNFNDDKLGKPVGIHQHIGKRPVFTAGNSDGDYAMLQYTSTGTGPHFGMIVNHTDEREFVYDITAMSHLEKGLTDAAKYNWQIVDMKKDWKKVYPFE